MHYANVITDGSDKHATKYARDLSISRAAELRDRIQPFFLRREKDILGGKARFRPPLADQHASALCCHAQRTAWIQILTLSLVLHAHCSELLK
jgi:hypothetical protein